MQPIPACCASRILRQRVIPPPPSITRRHRFPAERPEHIYRRFFSPRNVVPSKAPLLSHAVYRQIAFREACKTHPNADHLETRADCLYNLLRRFLPICQEFMSDKTEHSPLPQAFADLGVRPSLLRALADLKFTEPSEIQKLLIPRALAGVD